MSGRPADPGEAGPRVGTIFVVATPIGNLEDVTLRAIRVLREVDLVAAEDTRRTRLLLRHLGITKRVVAYYDAVEAARAPDLVRRALAGESIALVSDAGTPLIADPGFRLVRAAIDAGIDVVPVPGPSAPLALLSCAGLPPGRFTFVGFLPARRSGRRRALLELADRTETLLFFETARRLAASLADMADVFGPRPCVVGRELTKRFEEIVRGDLGEIAESFAGRVSEGALRGELVIALGGRPERSATAAGGAEPAEPLVRDEGFGGARREPEPDVGGVEARVEALLRRHLASGAGVAAAARAVAAATGLPRREVYRRAVALREADTRAAQRG
jgi:16S rRNA (cytidine1402-2'-O)-methyltransferase